MPVSTAKKKALYALGALVLLMAGLLLFVMAAQEQSIRSHGSPDAEKIRLEDLATRGPGSNQHIELTDFYFGSQFIYTAKLIQFRDVYVPVFPRGQSEEAKNLRVLVWIKNDRNSNQRLIQGQQDLERFIADFNRHPSITGVLQKPISRVKSLTAEAYPQVNQDALLVLWAREYPDESSIEVLWGLCGVCLLAAVACVVGYRAARAKTA